MAGNPAPAPTPVPIEIAAPAMSWTGFYAGGLVSFDEGHFENDLAVSVPLVAVTSFGGFAGYNKQVNAMVFGGEVAYSVGDLALTGFPDSIYSERLDVKARVGYSLGRALVYGVVGYSWSELDDFGALYPVSGLNYGVGVDLMITNRLFVGVEYLMRDVVYEDDFLRNDVSINSAAIRAGIKF